MFTSVRQLRDSSFTLDPAAMATFQVDDMLEKEKREKAERAEKRRRKLMAKISKMQKSFIQDNEALFQETSTELPAAGSSMDLR